MADCLGRATQSMILRTRDGCLVVEGVVLEIGGYKDYDGDGDDEENMKENKDG